MHAMIPNTITLISIVLILLIAIEHYFKRAFLPVVCLMLLAGVGYGGLRHAGFESLPGIHLTGEVGYFILLPLLIFNASRKITLDVFRGVAFESSIFATLGMLITAGIVGVPLALMANIPVVDGLLFGAIVAATDPVAVSALFKRFSMPKRLHTMIEADSMLNDGTAIALVTFLSMTAVRNAPFSVPETTIGFIVASAGAIAFGGAGGWIVGMVARWWHVLHDRFIGALLPLASMYLLYIVGDHLLHVSGVITVLSASVVFMTLHRRRDAALHGHDNNDADTDDVGEDDRAIDDADYFFDDFWNTLARIVQAILFFALGEAFGEHTFDVPLFIIPVVIVLALLGRAVGVYGLSPLLRLTGRRIPMGWQHILALSGLKGGVSVAMVLLLPPDYEYRYMFLCGVLVLVLVTVIVNTIAMRIALHQIEFD